MAIACTVSELSISLCRIVVSIDVRLTSAHTDLCIAVALLQALYLNKFVLLVFVVITMVKHQAIWDFEGIYASSRHIPGVRFAGLIHPGLMVQEQSYMINTFL